MDLPLPSSAWYAEPLHKLFRRKLIPNLEHVTWSEPTVTSSKLAISTRLAPCAIKSLIFSIACGVNFTGLPLDGGLAFVSVMAAKSIGPRLTRRRQQKSHPIADGEMSMRNSYRHLNLSCESA